MSSSLLLLIIKTLAFSRDLTSKVPLFTFASSGKVSAMVSTVL